MIGRKRTYLQSHPAFFNLLHLSSKFCPLSTANYLESVRSNTGFAFTTKEIIAKLKEVAQSLADALNKPRHDPRQTLSRFDVWRRSLAAKLHVDADTETDVYYLNVEAMSYRFECILCRLMRRSFLQSRHEDWSDWTSQRLRSAVLELDAIAMRVLTSGILHDFPITL